MILTEDRYVHPDLDDWYQAQIAREEGLVAAALEAHGLRVERRAWSDGDMDWTQCRGVLFRSTWDYFDRFTEFARGSSAFRARHDSSTTRPDPLERGQALSRRARCAGVPIVPTRFVERGDAVSLAAIMEAEGWDEIVFKPAVSGAARLTFRANRASLAQHEPVFARCVADEAMMVQRFEPAIVNEGELSLIVIAGRATHAIRKTARAGDFRVQDDHGGTVHPHASDAAQCAFAEAAVAACPALPLYARVDFVRAQAGGYRLMELELVEPELFFRFHPPAADALAQELAEKLR
ncbi:hypothetical protein [Thauera humireducens]|uniref:ATP-grasp domain-containing protein n=1 Tax=Thauera humireducens TaxID=1134435 RepID=UPI00311E95B1